MSNFKTLHKEKLKCRRFIGEFYQMLKEKLVSIPHKFFQKIEEKKIFPQSFYEVDINLVPKSDKDMKGKEKD